ncbi:hypothetical protein LPJ78_002656 [Coemansia sp. RSA 989]|nr:hypothetical protein BX667DRAFT_246604 [Coemansia mojavensis]KAJ1865482.1 hypothetical protein LPJ78_002656 [Coemansia sp. RSA 989]KAJ2676545.1 hypothetical protein IWW42_000420 [Coemansia sp. RSA 1085]
MSIGAHISKAFPTVVWPVNRTEAPLTLKAVDPATVGCVLPVMPSPESSKRSCLRWHPISILPKKHTRGLLAEIQDPVVLRPTARIPGYLAPNYGSPQDMISQFQKACSDTDISYEMVTRLFRDAALDTAWNIQPPVKGNTVACCRPLLEDELSEDYEIDSEIAAALQHNHKVYPFANISTNDYKWTSHREWAMYAGGEGNNELWALPLPSKEDDFLYSSGYWPYIGTEHPFSEAEVAPSIKFTTRIRQVLAHPSHLGRVCVRTDSMVSILDLVQGHSGPRFVPRIEAKVVGIPYTYDNGDQWTSHMSWNPWRVSELALASGTGCVRLWDCATGYETELKSCDSENDIEWNCCEYWSCPRQLICANPDLLYMLDVRASKTQTSILHLKEYGSEDEVFTAICPSALHPQHAIAASTQAIRVFDQRYLKQPILAWEHKCLPVDPPMFLQSELLPNYSRGRAASIFAATEKSARVHVFTYGQDSTDQPYTSLDQQMIRPSSSIGNSYKVIQEALAVDPYGYQDYTNGHTYIPKYPSSSLSGVAVRIIESDRGNESADSSWQQSASAVCLCLDELGTVSGHQLVIAPDLDAAAEIDAKAHSFSSHLWKDAYEDEGAIVDGANMVLQTKSDVVHLREAIWADLQKRSKTYERVDMSDAYQHLLNSSDSQALQDMQRSLKRHGSLQQLRVEGSSGYEIINSISALQAAYSLSSDPLMQPWFMDSTIRRRLLSSDTADSTELLKLLCAGDGERPTLASMSDKVKDLCGMFGLDPNAHRSRAIASYIAEDIELASMQLDSAQGVRIERIEAGCGALDVLDSKLENLSKGARLLDSSWETEAVHSQRAAASAAHESAPSQTLRNKAVPSTAPPQLLTTARRNPTTAHTASLPPVDGFFSQAPKQHFSTSTQPKKKKQRKSGF